MQLPVRSPPKKLGPRTFVHRPNSNWRRQTNDADDRRLQPFIPFLNAEPVLANLLILTSTPLCVREDLSESRDGRITGIFQRKRDLR